MTDTRLPSGGTPPRTPRGLSGGEAGIPDRRPSGGTPPRIPQGTSGHPANDAWEALLSVHAALMRRFAAQDVWADLSMREYDVLYTLSKCREPIRLTELNRHVLLSQPALSRMVDRLAERGLIDRATDPADGRGVRLSLTADGRAVQRLVGRRHARSVAQSMLAGLTPAELRQLGELCAKLVQPPLVLTDQARTDKETQ
jgi:DNA-binding MarR family transcriptional regulator